MRSEDASDTRQKILATVAVLVVIIFLVLAAKAATPKKGAGLMTATQPSATPAQSSPSGSSAASTYKDGAYTAIGSSDTPGGVESIQVTLTLQGDTVTNADVVGLAARGDSVQYQEMFIEGYQPYVVGKKIDDLHLSRVSGASLTTDGFNDALQQIKSQAQG